MGKSRETRKRKTRCLQKENWRAQCQTEKTRVITKASVNRCVDCDDDISTQGPINVSATSKDRFVINARISRSKIDQLNIFGDSIEIYHIVDEKYYPIELLTNELEYYKSTSLFVDLDLEFEYKFENPTLTA